VDFPAPISSTASISRRNRDSGRSQANWFITTDAAVPKRSDSIESSAERGTRPAAFAAILGVLPLLAARSDSGGRYRVRELLTKDDFTGETSFGIQVE
jgi:hypothetical protein